MKLEDCTKVELIYFIRNNVFFSGNDLERGIQSCRANIAMEKQREADDAGNRALEKYIEHLGNFEGAKLADAPLNVLREMDAAHKEWKQCCARSDKYRKEWDAAVAALKGTVSKLDTNQN